MATAAASETVYLSRVSPWRKVGVGLGAVSVSECKRPVCVCARAGAWLLRDWAAIVSQGSQESQEQVLGGHLSSTP